jgi:hypothetical protein
MVHAHVHAMTGNGGCRPGTRSPLHTLPPSPIDAPRLITLTVPAAILDRGWLRLMATVMMSPMLHDLPDWLMTWASLAPELSVTCVGKKKGQG